MLRRVSRWFRPSFDETTLLLMAATCVVLLVTHSRDVAPVLRLPREFNGAGIYVSLLILLAVAFLGLLAAIVNAFMRREKSAPEKTLMAVFVLVTNVGAGVLVGMEGLSASSGTSVLALLNIGASVLLFYQLVLIDGGVISDEDAPPADVILGLAILSAVLVFCQYMKFSWPMTFSTCVAYATLAHAAVTRTVRAGVALIVRN